MTDNDYIAEYVKETCPELIRTRRYFEWKVGKYAANAAKEIADMFYRFMSEDDTEAAGDEEEKRDQDTDHGKQRC